MKHYYSALDKEDTSLNYPAVSYMEYEGSIAFVHNIEKQERLPSGYDDCDLLYAEIPWKDGYDIFNVRAGIKGTEYRNFMSVIRAVISQNKQKAIFILCGKLGLKMLPVPDYLTTIRLNGFPAQGVFYGFTGIQAKDTNELLSILAKRFNRIGDFCCGYGDAGKAFAQAGKKFTLSDINPRCIGYIDSQVKGWYENI